MRPVSEEPRARWPLLVRGLVIAVCGILLGIGGCAAFLDHRYPAMGYVFGGAFFVGVLMLLVGGVMFIAGIFKWFVAQGQGSAPEE